MQEEGIPLGAAFAEVNVKDSRAVLPDALKQLELIKCIRDYKEQHPDLYRLGLAHLTGHIPEQFRLHREIPQKKLMDSTVISGHANHSGV